MNIFKWFREMIGAAPNRERRPQNTGATPLARWQLNWGGKPHVVSARTRSEARAKIKQLLGLKRLPPGCLPVRNGEEEVAA